jgi:glutamine synthetase
MDKTTRIEYRHPDPSCNPYLAAVCMIKAGMNGVKEKIEPPRPHSDNIYNLTKNEIEKLNIEMLPEHLGQAVDYFVKDSVLTEALGSYISKNLVHLKTKEFEDYMSFTGQIWAKSRPKITSWELDRYLTRC